MNGVDLNALVDALRAAQAGAPVDHRAQALAEAFGMIDPGNIDLRNRPKVRNPDGSISTVRTISINEDGSEVLIPTVSDDGRVMPDAEAVEQYRRTHRSLGRFRTPQGATQFAERLHEQQAKDYLP